MLGANQDRTISLAEVAKAYGISLNHLKKVSARLVENGLVHTERGRSGGLRLLRELEDVRLGEIFRITQTDTAFIECLGGDPSVCVISPVCKLQSILVVALKSFEKTLNEYTLADLVYNPEALNDHLGMELIASSADLKEVRD